MLSLDSVVHNVHLSKIPYNVYNENILLYT